MIDTDRDCVLRRVNGDREVYSLFNDHGDYAEFCVKSGDIIEHGNVSVSYVYDGTTDAKKATCWALNKLRAYGVNNLNWDTFWDRTTSC